jgi:hypothetical protein
MRKKSTVSTDVEKTFDKIQCRFFMKIVHKLEIEMNFFTLLKDVCIKPIPHIILKEGSLNASS